VLAAVHHATNEPLRIEEVELAPPGPAEVCVRIQATGVCHSDWNAIVGDSDIPLPSILGHEGSGVVEEVGDGVQGVEAGDHVVLSWMPSCGHCFYCRRGRPNLCESALPGFFAGTLLNGAIRLSQNGQPVYHYSFLSTFAERAVVPAASCIPIRRDVPLEVAAIVGCAVMTGVGAVINRARVQAGSVAVVFGAGGVGLSVVLGCRLAGARAIVAVDPVASKRALAVELGATHAVDPLAEDAGEVARELTEGRGADYAFVAAGVPALFLQAYTATRRAGTVVCIGLPREGTEVSFPATALVREEKIVTGSLYGTCRDREDMPKLLDLYMEGRLDLDRLITRTYPLDQINEAFADMNAGKVARGVLDLRGETG
jgi:S-(hydroxymethyl)glutathione dehydrogenase / alcohol dehydrogenase